MCKMKGVLQVATARAAVKMQDKIVEGREGLGEETWWREYWRTGESLQGRHTSALDVTLIPRPLSRFLHWSRQLLRNMPTGLTLNNAYGMFFTILCSLFFGQ